MNNPMIIDAEDIIIDTTSEKGEIQAEVTTSGTENYKYCIMGIKLAKARVATLKAHMLADTQFYVEIKFKDVLNTELAPAPKFVHQFFNYDVLDETAEILELKLDGYYALPLGYSSTSVHIISAKLYFAEIPTNEQA